MCVCVCLCWAGCCVQNARASQAKQGPAEIRCRNQHTWLRINILFRIIVCISVCRVLWSTTTVLMQFNRNETKWNNRQIKSFVTMQLIIRQFTIWNVNIYSSQLFRNVYTKWNIWIVQCFVCLFPFAWKASSILLWTLICHSEQSQSFMNSSSWNCPQ